ncbi:uncharacterized protein LOC129601804 [Paramacrobiotus metropolitanus]|uniref:uncharacterized protein LOC129601804 n=1 Tax=Paramacrobiotus metropolitanus TaxID=2943436 RepID=UPI0024457ACE|nr:uncharacterized protein LOC129601804 [Paramacrobiotus metropolitanus]
MQRNTAVLILSLVALCTDRISHSAHALNLPGMHFGRGDFSNVMDVYEPKYCWVYRDEYFNGIFSERIIIDGGQGTCVNDTQLADCVRSGLSHTKEHIKCEICDVRWESCCYLGKGTIKDSIFPRGSFLFNAVEEPPESCCVSNPTPPPTTSPPKITTTPETPYTVTDTTETTVTITPPPGTLTTPTVSTTPTPSTTAPPSKSTTTDQQRPLGHSLHQYGASTTS